jgi:hypothetical protein
MKPAAYRPRQVSTLLLLDSVLKQARELRGEVSAGGLYPAEITHFERALSEIEDRALKLFSTLV